MRYKGYCCLFYLPCFARNVVYMIWMGSRMIVGVLQREQRTIYWTQMKNIMTDVYL
jgi:hypothetical protein